MRKFNVVVNGNSYCVEVEEIGAGETVATPVASAPVAAPVVKKAVAGGGVEVKSPMPGKVLKLAVAEGATVKKGDKLIGLEAMKMEQDINADADGVVSFFVKPGDDVESGALLASIK